MEIASPIENQRVTEFSFTTGSVLSADGTVIGYRQVGRGPGLVIIHGGTRASQHYSRLALALADSYTVTLPDRRGRGLSGPIRSNHTIHTECADLKAVLKQTGAKLVFGHSAGGLIGLEAALKLPVEKLAVYEPAVSLDQSMPLDWLPVFEEAIKNKDYARAFALMLKGLRLGWMAGLPLWLLTALANTQMNGAEGQELRELLPTMVWDAKMAQAMDQSLDRYRLVQAQTLMIGGSQSPAYLKNVLPILARTIPYAHYVIFDGLNHNAPDQYAPEQIAAELKRFFL